MTFTHCGDLFSSDYFSGDNFFHGPFSEEFFPWYFLSGNFFPGDPFLVTFFRDSAATAKRIMDRNLFSFSTAAVQLFFNFFLFLQFSKKKASKKKLANASISTCKLLRYAWVNHNAPQLDVPRMRMTYMRVHRHDETRDMI